MYAQVPPRYYSPIQANLVSRARIVSPSVAFSRPHAWRGARTSSRSATPPKGWHLSARPLDLSACREAGLGRDKTLESLKGEDCKDEGVSKRGIDDDPSAAPTRNPLKNRPRPSPRSLALQKDEARPCRRFRHNYPSRRQVASGGSQYLELKSFCPLHVVEGSGNSHQPYAVRESSGVEPPLGWQYGQSVGAVVESTSKLRLECSLHNPDR